MNTERKERRAHPRVHLVARVEVQAAGRSFLAIIRNVSAGGMLIYTANPARAARSKSQQIGARTREL